MKKATIGLLAFFVISMNSYAQGKGLFLKALRPSANVVACTPGALVVGVWGLVLTGNFALNGAVTGIGESTAAAFDYLNGNHHDHFSEIRSLSEELTKDVKNLEDRHLRSNDSLCQKMKLKKRAETLGEAGSVTASVNRSSLAKESIPERINPIKKSATLPM